MGTHFDVVKDDFPPSFSDYLQQKIREKFINVSDPEKCGLPKVFNSFLHFLQIFAFQGIARRINHVLVCALNQY